MNALPDTHILGGRLIDPYNGIDEVTDLFLRNGVVAGIGQPPKDFSTELRIAAHDCIVCPGLIDLAVHLREPGQLHKASIASETRAAVSGGITTLVCTPDTDPVIDTPAVWELIRHAAQASDKARVLAAGALTQGLRGQQLAEMVALLDSGCVVCSNGDQALADNLITRQVMEYASTFGIRVFIRPQDRHLGANGCVHEGAVATRLGLPGIPAVAETLSVASHIALVAETGSAVHFRGLSTAVACRQIAEAQARKLPVTADVAIHQLHLTEVDVDGFNALCHVSPPLRTLADRDGLRQAVADGTIGCICSDHQPHEADAKNQPFAETAAGISGLETLLPLSLKLVDEGVLDMSSMIRALTATPASVIGQPLGQLAVGSVADVCLFDPEQIWTLRTEEMRSAGHNSPFDGWELKGKVLATFVAGKPVYTATSALSENA